MEAAVGRILGWLPIFCPHNTYTLYYLIFLSMGGISKYMLAWKKEKSQTVNYIGETYVARTKGRSLGTESKPRPTA